MLARIFYPGQGVNVNIQSEACQGRANEINTLEHVQVGNFFFLSKVMIKYMTFYNLFGINLFLVNAIIHLLAKKILRSFLQIKHTRKTENSELVNFRGVNRFTSVNISRLLVFFPFFKGFIKTLPSPLSLH